MEVQKQLCYKKINVGKAKVHLYFRKFQNFSDYYRICLHYEHSFRTKVKGIRQCF